VSEESEVTGRLGRFNRKFVEEVDWMSEAEIMTTATTQPPPKKKGDDAIQK
jgi:hypothetical protein